MSEIHYQIEFFSPWLCGSGMGGGDDADYRPLLDANGLPFVPGKTIKGLLREAATAIGCNNELTEKIFGRASTRQDGVRGDSTEGTAHFSNAEIPPETQLKILQDTKLADELLLGRYFTQIEANGQVKDKSLRRGEYAVPMRLEGRIYGVEESERTMLEQCMGYIKQLGTQRSRGFGRCRMTAVKTVEETAAMTPDILRSPNGEYHFRCTFLAPVVLNRSAATEGTLECLEYIPGANWLGIAARRYADYGKEAFAVFHSGAVQFGFGYPMTKEGNGTLPCPANWFIPKGESLGNAIIYPTPEKREAVQKEKQPKQVRGGFFTSPNTPTFYKSINTASFSLKSAYDSDQRCSEDSQMYGYTALPAGSQWHFTVRVSDTVSDTALQRLVSSLVGIHQIGRSRTSQYGLVRIELLSQAPIQTPATAAIAEDLYLLYAASPLAFLDANGEYTPVPAPADLGFPEGATLDTAYSQIRTGAYAPWNGVRKSRDAERQVILPGSVLAVRSATPPDAAKIQQGLGLFRCEGLGRALVNPAFLNCEKLADAPQDVSTASPQEPAVGQDPLVNFLAHRAKENADTQDLYRLVQKFSDEQGKKFSKISRSQWGTIRAAANALRTYSEVCDYLFKEDDKQYLLDNLAYAEKIKNGRNSRANHPGFLRHGKVARPWEKCWQDLKTAMEEAKKRFGEDTALLFLQLLTAKMAKNAKK
ncbi:MAG: hypothetical protein IKO65_04575 [Victivallales bacterium]|nr:hypothetical protein [Victivallales bacterium]